MDSVGTDTSSNVDVVVRCAFQTGNDIRVNCPLTWTVMELKQHLHTVCTLHPSVTSQRLIYAGACLTDKMTIAGILERRRFEGDPVFHLVCPLPQSSPQLRKRDNVAATPAQGSNTAPTIPTAANAPLFGANVQSPTDYAQAYQAYYGWYMQNYAHMMSYYQNASLAAAGSGIPAAFPFGAAGAPGAFGFPLFPQQGAAMVGVGNEPAAPAAVPANVGANAVPANEGGRNYDFLEIIYGGIRLGLLLLALTLYSSWERFTVVVLIGLFIFFIQIRRGDWGRFGGIAAAPQQPQVNNNNNGEALQGENAPPNNPVVDDGLAGPAELTGVQIFFSTCYSFITSFFTSLVPENNPAPVNLN